MNENIENALSMMEEGWKAREALRFEEAEKLLNDAKAVFETENDWFNVTECLNHLVYLNKMKSVSASHQALETARLSLRTAEEHGTKTTMALRALMSACTETGNFEEGLGYARKFKEILGMDNIAAYGDAEQHLAYFLLRTGDPQEALSTVEHALDHIEEGWAMEQLPQKAIWRSSALLTKSRILYTLGNFPEAKFLAGQALQLAKDHELKTRILEIRDLKSFLDK